MPSWCRYLVKPLKGYAVVHLDYKGQEVGAAAALTHDDNMIAAYLTKDPYLWYARRMSLVPENATRQTHWEERELYKTALLAINYGMGAESLALRINRPVIFARHLIERHHELFPDYWRWSNRAVNHALLFGWQSSVFGWIHRLPPSPRPTALRNFPIQSAGAEALRLAHCLATENGVRVCATIHDALVIEVKLEDLDRETDRARSHMADASRVVLHGFELFIDVKAVRYPDRYSSIKGERLWHLVMQKLQEVEAKTSTSANTSELAVLV